mmetsp:Transcript_86748/g.250358  ORF Transcript_86748/g.250358 Transcript_86748/m.250358 type:complete len:205 (-) Transcript_86748:1965-2579(-)
MHSYCAQFKISRPTASRILSTTAWHMSAISSPEKAINNSSPRTGSKCMEVTRAREPRTEIISCKYCFLPAAISVCHAKHPSRVFIILSERPCSMSIGAVAMAMPVERAGPTPFAKDSAARYKLFLPALTLSTAKFDPTTLPGGRAATPACPPAGLAPPGPWSPPLPSSLPAGPSSCSKAGQPPRSRWPWTDSSRLFHHLPCKPT